MREFKVTKRLPVILLLAAFSSFSLFPIGRVSGRLSPGPQAQFPRVSPVASYRIRVGLNTAAKTLEAHETVRYANVTQTAIPDLVFHLYLNAFRDRNSIFLRESGDAHRGYAWDSQHPGWIKVTGIRLADGTPLSFEEIEDGTLGKAALPKPIDPGETTVIEVDFQARLPRVFARTGFVGDFYMVGQWFPKLGVWQDGAWNAYPFHANSEFYADFGAYDVEITLPSGYVTGGVGLPASPKDNGDGTQTIAYHAEGVIDFAWTASPHFQEAARRVEGVELLYLYLPEHAWTVKRVLDATEAAVHNYSEWYGPYAYPRLTVVDVPGSGGGAGGMEYPTLFTAGTIDLFGVGSGLLQLGLDRILELEVMHEAGHQWWQSMVAFNEAEEPWLDEGFTDYSTVRLAGGVLGEDDSAVDAGNLKMSYLDLHRSEYLANPAVPMYGRAWDFSGPNDYTVATYSKPALSLSMLERVLGKTVMLKILASFFERYRFTHPTTEDFRSMAEEISGQDLSWFFDGLVYGKGVLNYTVTAVDRNSVTVARQGDLAIPTEVQVKFSDGSTLAEAWDGNKTPMTYSYPDRPAVESVVVDPERKILVDLVWSDNGLRRSRDMDSWAALVSRFLYHIQDILLILGGW